MKVDIYWNLNAKPASVFSVKSRERDNYGIVVKYLKKGCIKDVEFVVQPAGQAWVRKNKRKKVHAFIRGVLVSRGSIKAEGRAMYSPYKTDTYIDLDTREEVKHTQMVKIGVRKGKPFIIYEKGG